MGFFRFGSVLLAVVGLAWASAGAAETAEAPDAERERPFCTTACRPGGNSGSSGVGFAAGIAATLLIARRQRPDA